MYSMPRTVEEGVRVGMTLSTTRISWLALMWTALIGECVEGMSKHEEESLC
jgi:hypothetical protein